MFVLWFLVGCIICVVLVYFLFNLKVGGGELNIESSNDRASLRRRAEVQKTSSLGTSDKPSSSNYNALPLRRGPGRTERGGPVPGPRPQPGGRGGPGPRGGK